MIEVNEGKVNVHGTVETIEMEMVFLLISIYDKEPESLTCVLHNLMDYMDGKFELKHREVHDDSI